MKTERIDNDTGADEDFDTGGDSGAELEEGGAEDFDAQALWNETVSSLKKESETPETPETGPGEEEEETSAEEEQEGEEQEGEEQGEEESEEEPEETAAELKARLAAVEAKLQAQSEAEEEGEEADPDLELTEQEKELLEFSEGLDTMVEKLATKAALKLFKKYKQDQAAEASKETEAAKEETFWGELSSWFSEESPDLKLDQVRQSPDFNDWLANHKTWVDTQLASAKGKYDTSGAKAVFKRYMRESNPGSPPPSKKTPGGKKRMAAARTPASLSTTRKPSRPEATSADAIWKQETARLAKQHSAAQQYL